MAHERREITDAILRAGLPPRGTMLRSGQTLPQERETPTRDGCQRLLSQIAELACLAPQLVRFAHPGWLGRPRYCRFFALGLYVIE